MREFEEVVIDGNLSMTKLDGQSVMELVNQGVCEVVATYPGIDVGSGDPRPCRYALLRKAGGKSKKQLLKG